jgi:hypothetical protein
MSMNYYMMETMARAIQEERIREAERDSRWSELRRATRERVKPQIVEARRDEECVQEKELGVAA